MQNQSRPAHRAERTQSLPLSGIREIFQAANRLEAEGKHVIHFEIGRPDFDTPAHIKEAAKAALDAGQTAYTSNWGIPELRTAIAAKMARDHDVRADPETDIIVTAGAIEAVYIAMMGTLNPGDEVILLEPTWPHYRYCAQLAGAHPVFVPLQADAGFQIDPDVLRDYVTPQTRMIVINTPHNPTGTCLNLETLRGIAGLAVEHDLLVLADEIYEQILYDNQRHYSIASLPDMWSRTLTINGFSKAFSMTGWRLGYLVAPAAFIDAAVRIHQYTTTCVTTFAQYGAVAALVTSQECVREMVAELDRRRNLVVDALQAIAGVTCVRPQAAFYAFPSFGDIAMSSAEFVQYLLNEFYVATVPGSGFGAGGEGHIRIAYSTGYDDVREGLQRIEAAIDRLW